MRVLVCGGAGYIGSNMTAMLTAEGHEPIVFDNLSTGHRAAVGQAEAVKAIALNIDQEGDIPYGYGPVLHSL